MIPTWRRRRIYYIVLYITTLRPYATVPHLKPFQSLCTPAGNRTQIKGLEDPYDKLFQSLGQAGASRGGWGTPSPLWADEIDLEANSVPKLNQIVGHTPVKTVTEHIVKNGDKTSHKLFFCDTHSLAYLPYVGTTFPIGDRTCLEIHLEEQTSCKIINL